jgi:hypothetical protein
MYAVKTQKFPRCRDLFLVVEVSNKSSHLILGNDAWPMIETQVLGSFILRFPVF